MQLKSLQLAGFKTFAEKTEIDLAGGLTAVVGPNGCGKSNVADALLWVMGEQNPRLLRGLEARDVIFAGTDRRKPLGLAEVRLTVDNSEGRLPIQAAEISIARRVYRNGESQYLINGAQCRLKDVVELFLDTGAGKGAYSFVTQSEVDAVLSAKAEDRRELFEEAAGIKKYRVKKREAQRKLETAEGNLTRVRDILAELNDQREPMREQAEKAKRYKELVARLEQIEIDLLVAEVHQLDYELYASRQSLEMEQESLDALKADLKALDQEFEAARLKVSRAEGELEHANQHHQAAVRALERTSSQLQLMEQRGQGAEENADTLADEVRSLSERAAHMEKEALRLERECESAEARRAAAQSGLDGANEKLKEVTSHAESALSLVEEKRRTMLRLAEKRAHAEAAMQACLKQIAATQDRITQQNDRQAALRTSLQEAETRRDRLSADSNDARNRLAELHSERAKLTDQRRTFQEAQSACRLSLEQTQRLVTERTSRLTTLQELQEAGDGFYQGVKSVLSAARHGSVRGEFKPVVDLLQVPPELRVAVEVALGGSLQDIVCATEAEAKSAIQWLKQNRAGRATFLPLSLLRPSPGLTAKDIAACTGLVGVGPDLISVAPEHQAALQLLLGRVVFAETMDSAVEASRKAKGWNRIVTLEGELITPGGAMTGGSLQGKGSHLVGRKGEIDDLKRELPDLQAKQAALEADLSKRQADLEAITVTISSSDALVEAALAENAALERDAQSAEREAQRLSTATVDLEREAAALTEAQSKLEMERAEWSAFLATSPDELEAEAASGQAELESLIKERDQARNEASKAQVDLVRASEQHSALNQSLQACRRSLDETQAARNAKQAQRDAAATAFRDANLSAADLRTELEAARQHAAECEETLLKKREARNQAVAMNQERDNKLRSLTVRQSEAQQAMHESQLQIARYEVKLAQASQRLEEEYGITQEQALQREDPPEVSKDTALEVGRLRREVRSMGEVNTGAVEEYDRITERHEFLFTQQADLEKACTTLLETIAEIDESTRDVFMETFNAVGAEFQRLFDRLFGGGETRLQLTQPDNLLETGIEIIAQPPGKKPMSLSLLSGGERALTAVALIFAFLAVRPSPFVVLDEVDAPLDGSNVEKFALLVKEFSERSQFLVITHNPTTMEASPRWYGVTMSEPGVSRVMAYRVPEQATQTADVPEPLEAALIA